MKTRIVRLTDLDKADFQRWRDLADRAIEPNAFLDPRLIAPDGHVPEDMVKTRFLFVEDGERLCAVMGFEVVTGRVFRMPLQVLKFGGWDYSTRRYPLVDPKDPVESMKALLLPARTLRLPRVFELDFLPATGALNDAFLEATAALRIEFRVGESFDYAYSFPHVSTDTPPADPSSTKRSSTGTPAAGVEVGHLSGRSRRRIQKDYREILRHAGGELTISDRGDDPAAITEFLDLQAAGWKGDASKGGIAFRITPDLEWFVKATDAFRADGALSVFTLSTTMTTVYMAVVLRGAGGAWGAQDTYNEDFAQFQPGNVGRLAVLEHILSQPDVRFYDPNLRPAYVESTRLFPDRRRYTNYVVYSRVPLARFAIRTAAMLHSVSRALHRA